ncbi:Cloroperoxidase [Aspergillus heteromorphus CBS 117.55]|uniref:Cloroperoxidase n=1 Tax=Aspergillus heteromorphus CBS 117.55 TaxID=1448321 RepID=A0A317X6I3_9EURO|nr:Cloroperoxidase [Aspergillus heteromorphus CBS 117.55]PWY92180.1 Cloroperoxidase [Aspergillus heteromorphus CBS 117.55]
MALQGNEHDHHPAGPDDLRSPCPVLNTLANHGLIARNGRDITATQLKSAIQYIGLGFDVATALVSRVFEVHADDPSHAPPGTSRAGLRDPNQVNKDGIPVLNLDQVGRPHALEHDVSITRQDRELGDCIHLDPDLYKQFIQASQDGRYRSSVLGSYRKTRYEEQKRINPHLQFGKFEHYVGCAEMAALRCVFGQGVSRGVPGEYVRAVFGDERLPYNEGWKPRRLKAFFPEMIPVLLLISHYAWPF